MDVRTPQPEALTGPYAAGAPERAPIKFLYPTGSQPLEGYTIKRGIGRGGFGEVYFATSDAGKEVALKLIRRNLDVELRGVRHCLNLKHQNLIGVYDIRSDSLDDQWVIMEYVSGESLEDAIARHPDGMPPDEILRWMRGIGAGVAYLHDHGIVHRDLKPGNVFIDLDSSDGGTVKIGDYGLSKFISCSRRSGQTESVGTVHYMAPEIANGRYGREIDTYALGIMLYEMLTGHVPFEGESVGEVLMKHLTAEPELSSLESPYREIVQRTLAKDPEVRIGSVHELLSLLPDGRSVGPLYPERPLGADKIDGWTAQHAAPDGIGGSHTFGDTSVRGAPPAATARSPVDAYAGQEPLYVWTTTKWRGLVEGWYAWSAHPVAKALLLFLVVGAAIATIGTWGRVAILLGIVYVIYYAVWAVLIRPFEERRQRKLHRNEPPDEHPAAPESATQLTPADVVPKSVVERRREAALRAHHLRSSWKEVVHQRLAEKPTRVWLTELLSSMVLAGILCAFFSLFAVALVGSEVPAERIPLHLWLTGVSTIGTWVILLTAKFSEGRFEDQVPMRLWQLTGGGLMGVIAAGLSAALLLDVPLDRDFGIGPWDSLMASMLGKHSHLYQGPDVLLHVLYFSLVFAALRWWRLGEYTRRVRVSLFGIGIAICGAWIAHLVCWYPQPAGVAVAGIVAVSVQVASPWLPASKRKQAAQQAVAV